MKHRRQVRGGANVRELDEELLAANAYYESVCVRCLNEEWCCECDVV